MWQFLQQSLSCCLKTHSKCQANEDSQWVPKRLLLLTREQTGLEKVRLIDTQDYTGLGRYIALSYCWGNSPTLLATEDTLSTLRDGISIAELPAVMRDCATVASRMGVQSLWIDSLCIVQDDREDWAVQSQQMGQIYENALFMVAACCSPDSSTPFLGHHAPSDRLHSVSFSLNYASENLAHVRARNLDKFTWYIGDNPLEKRGWAWQERMLSRRKINFISNEAIWACAEAKFYEDGKVEDNDQNPWSTENLSLHDWYWAMKDYSTRELTYARDRLPAVSGVAARFHATRNCDYYAGLWANDFPYCLGWFRHGHNDVESSAGADWIDAMHNGVPSWSWASIPGKVRWPHIMDNLLMKDDKAASSRMNAHVQLLEAQCDPSSDNDFGEVLPGSYLRVRGKAIEAIMECDGRGHGLVRQEGFSPQLVVPDCVLALSSAVPTDGTATGRQHSLAAIKRADDRDLKNSPRQVIKGLVLCMLIYSIDDCKQDIYDLTKPGKQAFVLVLSGTSPDNSVYERVAAGTRHWGPVYQSRQHWKQWEGWNGLEEWEKWEDWFSNAKTLDITIT